MTLFSLNRPTHHARRRHQLRPRLDALEDRFLLTAGDLDTTFGSGGVVLTSFPPVSKNFHGTGGNAFDVKIQSDGKIVAAGWGLHDFAVSRYNTNGSLDPTFGSGGKVETDFGQQNEDDAYGLAIQPDGKIVVVGTTAVTVGRVTNSAYAVARYNTNGTLDTSFGPKKNGLVTTIIPGTNTGDTVVIQPDGKIVLAGSIVTPGSTTYQCALVRYNPDGTLDASFGQGGIMTPTFVPGVSQWFTDVALEPVNGATEIVAAGPASSPSNALVARFKLDGSPDTSFGPGGSVILGSLNPGFSAGRLAIQPDGKIIDVGRTRNSQGVLDFAVARLNVDGSIDSAFGANGPTPGLVSIAGTDGGAATRAALQPDGKIVIGGGNGTNVMLARLNGADGGLDPAFGTSGVVVKSLTGGTNVKGMALQSDGKIVTAGMASGGSDGYFAVARFLGDTTTTTALAVVARQPTTDPSAPSPILVSLALDDPGFLDTVVSGKRRHTTSISPWIGTSDR